MFRYCGFGLSIHSEVQLPELPAGREQADIVIRYGKVPRIAAGATMHEEIAHFGRAGSFLIRDGREIILDPLPEVDPAQVRVLLVGRLMAFLLRQRGWLPLHGCGVEIEGEAILFLGPSGSGKSTIAAAFHTRGHQVITDDVAAVRVNEDNQCLIRPGGPRIRLWNNSLEILEKAEPGTFKWQKNVFDLSRNELPELMCVRRIYLLDDGDETRSNPFPPLEAVTILSRYSLVKHERMDKESLAVHLRHCAAVAAVIRVCRLTRPRSLTALPELVQWVESDAAK